MIEIHGDASRMAGLSAAERARAVDDAIEALLARCPEHERKRVEEGLRDDATFGQGTSDPELARHLQVIADARAVRWAELAAGRDTPGHKE